MRPVIGSLIHYMLSLNVEVHLLRILLCPNANFSELSQSLNIYGSHIDESFVLRSKGTLVCNSSSSVFNRTSPSLLHTFVVDTLLNFPKPFNLILTYITTSCLNAFRRLLVSFSIPGLPLTHCQ